MLAAALNLPKWLLAIVVFCVVAGHLEQLKCKLQGCRSVAVKSVEKSPAKGDPSPKGESNHCACACHTGTLASFELPPTFAILHVSREIEPVEWYDRAAEAPCAEIEYPPRAARA